VDQVAWAEKSGLKKLRVALEKRGVTAEIVAAALNPTISPPDKGLAVILRAAYAGKCDYGLERAVDE